MEDKRAEAIEKVAHSIAWISELLVDVSKSHISKQHCIDEIREAMDIVNNDGVWDLLYGRK